jgi:hypothetical protein
MSTQDREWRTDAWRAVAEAADQIRADGFGRASIALTERLDQRLRRIAGLAVACDRHGSAVERQLHASLVHELRRLGRARSDRRDAVAALIWPWSPNARLALAAGLTDMEWAILVDEHPDRVAGLARDRRLVEMLVGPGTVSIRVADRLAGGVRIEPSPTGQMPILQD